MSEPSNRNARQREEIGGVNNGFGPESPLDYAFAVVDEARPPVARRGKRLIVGRAEEVEVGQRIIVEEDGLSIGVYNIGGEFFAIKNVCPHAGAPLCQGHIQTTHRPSEVGQFDPALEGRILRCPWHGWEFDIVTGKGLYDRRSRVATYLVEVGEDGSLTVLL
jgi:nitrite reductase/ring-hydroxylating ferredoxin subunit